MSAPCPCRFTPPPERPGTHCIGAWVGHRAGLDWCGKSRPRRHSIPGPSSPYRVATQTELSRPTHLPQHPPQFLNKLPLFRTSHLHSNFGALVSHSFFTLIIVKICRAVSLSMFESFAIILKYKVQCVLKRITNFSTFSSVFVIAGRPRRWLSDTLSLPSENLLRQTYEL